jgi:hypothetical protein
MTARVDGVPHKVNCYRLRAVAANGFEFVLAVVYDTREQADEHVRIEISKDQLERPEWYSLAEGGAVKSSAIIALVVYPWFDPDREKPAPKRRTRSKEAVG